MERRGCPPSAACAAATSGPPRSRSRPASGSTALASSSGRSTSAVCSSNRGWRTRKASIRAGRTRARRSPGAPASAPPRRAAPGDCSCTHRAALRTASAIPSGRFAPMRWRSTTKPSISFSSPPAPRPMSSTSTRSSRVAPRGFRPGASAPGWRATITTPRTTRSRSRPSCGSAGFPATRWRSTTGLPATRRRASTSAGTVRVFRAPPRRSRRSVRAVSESASRNRPASPPTHRGSASFPERASCCPPRGACLTSVPRTSAWKRIAWAKRWESRGSMASSISRIRTRSRGGAMRTKSSSSTALTW